ncbi:MAG: hypothetical protein J0H49_29085 [Acidobacteria bacterium]|nr:hypothetical protein [Acidobacteriota bacterium]
MVMKQARPSLASLIAEVHCLATGRAITIAEAREYFKDPKCLADVVWRSGVLHNPPGHLRLQQLLDAGKRREHANGF